MADQLHGGSKAAEAARPARGKRVLCMKEFGSLSPCSQLILASQGCKQRRPWATGSVTVWDFADLLLLFALYSYNLSVSEPILLFLSNSFKFIQKGNDNLSTTGAMCFRGSIVLFFHAGNVIT